jgi:hypothetical protein
MADVTVTKYSVLKELVRKWATGKLQLLVIIGSPGVGKTRAITAAVGEQPHVIVRGKKSPLDLYVDLYRQRDQLVILDDVESVLATQDGQELIRDLTETSAVKTLRWGTQSQKLAELDVPKLFDTTSRAVILANRWAKGGIHDAIASRGIVVRFKPDWIEAYRYAGRWCRDQTVLDHVHRHLTELRQPDLRIIVNAVKLRRAQVRGVDWRDLFNDRMPCSKTRTAVAELVADVSFASDADRGRAFVEKGYGDRATFYRQVKEHRKRIGRAAGVKRIIARKAKQRTSVQEGGSEPGGGGDAIAANISQGQAGAAIEGHLCS